ncbi:DUF2852 domain-containing protein [Aestuariivirga litoralis]|uniref:DUF2852 domain-containing protein n=1 Tax=Aestuariivirga litoralis TaxID=2650924 RepID=UPI0018C53E6A|nr:DUF2852 domain-containing protein [Aestuariivirga litoralis]MBG1230848.1 DUF2852 domain-containing protein [Aestuariivirga litoralis]
MTYDRNEDKSDASGPNDGQRGNHWRGTEGRGFGRGGFGQRGFGPGDSGGYDRDWLSWARQPGFHPLKVVATVGAFAVFPPLGVLTLGYFLWNSRRGWGHGGHAFAGGPGSGEGRGRCGGGHRGMRRWSSGNDAFDQHARETMEKLREERHAFQAFSDAERRKRDQEAYDAFRAAPPAKPEDDAGSKQD